MQSARNEDQLSYMNLVYQISLKCVNTDSLNQVYTWRDEYNNYKFSVYEFQYKENFHPKPTSILIFITNNIIEDAGLLNNLTAFFEKAILGIESTDFLSKVSSDRIIFSGFSLGAGLAQIAACYHNQTAVTFESPGMRPVLENCLRERKDNYRKYEDVDITTFLTKPNEINTWGEQVGKIKRIYLNHVDETTYWHMALSALGIVRDAAALFFLGSYAYRKITGADIDMIVWNESRNVASYKSAIERKTADIINAEMKLAQIKLDPAVLANKESLIELWERVARMNSQQKASFIEYLSSANIKLEAAEKVITTVNNCLNIGGSVTVVTAITRAMIQMDQTTKENLVRTGQHELQRIVNALNNNQHTIVKTKNQEGYIFPITHWPTTLSQSWGTTLSNFAWGFFPLRPYNPGIMNILDENIYREARLELMDGYEPSPFKR